MHKLVTLALASTVGTIAHGSVVYDVEMTPEVAQRYVFGQPFGWRCATLEARESSFAIRCGSADSGDARVSPPILGYAHIEIRRRATGQLVNTLYAYEPLSGEGGIALPGHALCHAYGGCENPEYLSSASVPPIHYEDEFAVFHLNKVE